MRSVKQTGKSATSKVRMQRERVTTPTCKQPSKEALWTAKKWLEETRGSIPTRLADSLAHLLDSERAKARLEGLRDLKALWDRDIDAAWEWLLVQMREQAADRKEQP